MSNFDRLYAELVCYAHGAKLKDYSENIAVSESGDLVKEVHVVIMVSPVISDIEIVLTNAIQK